MDGAHVVGLGEVLGDFLQVCINKGRGVGLAAVNDTGGNGGVSLGPCGGGSICAKVLPGLNIHGYLGNAHLDAGDVC